MKRMFKSLRVEYLTCRTQGHRWDDVTGLGVWDHKVEYLLGFRETLRCETCGTLREVVWSDKTGDVMWRGYKYPDGYSLADVELPEGTTLRMAMRIEWGARSRAGELRQARERARSAAPRSRKAAARRTA